MASITELPRTGIGPVRSAPDRRQQADMSDRTLRILNVGPFALLGLFSIATLGQSAHGAIAFLSSLIAGLAHISAWGWSRCRDWPVAQGVFQEPSTPEGALCIEYTFEGTTFSRPANSKGAAGTPVAIRVNPENPAVSSLELPKPSVAFAVRATALATIAVVFLHAWGSSA